MKKYCARNVAISLFAAMLALVAACGGNDSTSTGPVGSISGTVTFLPHTWPATGSIFITVFAQYPPTGAPDAFTNPITENMLGPGRTYNYKISGLQTGTYKAVLIGWRGGVGNDRCIGLYWSYPDSVGIDSLCVAQAPGPSAVTVKKNTTLPDINMVADLSLAP